jgi:hypothetical protein
MGFGFLGLLDAGQGVESADGVADHGDGRPGHFRLFQQGSEHTAPPANLKAK